MANHGKQPYSSLEADEYDIEAGTFAYETQQTSLGASTKSARHIDGGDYMYGIDSGPSSISIRNGFIRKVYTILSLQLILTTAFTYMCMTIPSVTKFVQNNDAMFYTALFLPFIFIFALMYNQKKYPLNLFLLTIFTLCEAYTIGILCTYYTAQSVLRVFLLTAVVVVLLTAYTFQSKRDFSFMGSGLFSALFILIGAMMLQIFFPFPWLSLLISIAGAIIFSLYIIYDTSLIIHRLEPDEWIYGAISLYLDIINLFLMLLGLFGNRN